MMRIDSPLVAMASPAGIQLEIPRIAARHASDLTPHSTVRAGARAIVLDLSVTHLFDLTVESVARASSVSPAQPYRKLRQIKRESYRSSGIRTEAD